MMIHLFSWFSILCSGWFCGIWACSVRDYLQPVISHFVLSLMGTMCFICTASGTENAAKILNLPAGLKLLFPLVTNVLIATSF